MIEWVNNNLIEIIGAFLAFIYLILEIQKKWFFWIVGIISSAFYVYIFFYSGLYAEAVLNFYYILMSVYGLYCWKFSSKSSENTLVICRIDSKTSFLLFSLFFVFFGIISFVLYRFSDSQVPVFDSFIAVFSIIATWMAAKKFVECWYLWIFVNIIATGLYVFLQLYPTAILFSIYSILSFVGLFEWLKSVKHNDSTYTRL